MPKKNQSFSFRFLDNCLQSHLYSMARGIKFPYTLGEEGEVIVPECALSDFENDIVCKVRDLAFPEWQIISCPPDWCERYRSYMNCRKIPFFEEVLDGEIWFLIPRKYRPGQWKRLYKIPQ